MTALLAGIFIAFWIVGMIGLGIFIRDVADHIYQNRRRR